MADSWKTDGNCNECRRQKYCNKQCRAAKERIQKEIDQKAAEIMAKFHRKYDLQYLKYQK